MRRLRHNSICLTTFALLLFTSALAAADGLRVPYDTIGGDDVRVGSHNRYAEMSVDIADNGYIFAAATITDPTSGSEIQVFRSTDAGENFALWGTLSDPSDEEVFLQQDLDVVEGIVDAVYLLYRRNRTGSNHGEICMVNAPITDPMAVWSPEVVAMAQTGISFNSPRFDSDVSSHPNFYLYVVAEGNDFNGFDIWFTRSTDHGSSFETPYMLATLSVNNRDYRSPDIAHGFGGHLHVTWHFEIEAPYDDSIRYRRASNYANNGLADWDNWISMTPHNDGYGDVGPLIEAGAASDKLVLAYHRWNPDFTTFIDISLLVSHNAGDSWDPAWHWPTGPSALGELEEQPGTGVWMLLGNEDRAPCLYTAHEATLTSWTGPATFQDEALPPSPTMTADLALNPADGYRPATLWSYWGESPYYNRLLYFDADWLNDPGWPNYEPGFPISAPAGSATPVALVDMDQDGDLEIVYSEGMSIYAYHHDGSPATGWPVDVGTLLSNGPVAVGDLDGDGHPSVVAGTREGEAYAYDHEGNLLPGWPTLISGPGEYVYVSIGALGGMYVRTVVCVSSNLVRFRNHLGDTPTGATGWSFGGSYDFIAPAAIGDIDLDDIAEVVGARHTAVFAGEMMSPTLDFVISTGHAAYDAPTLGDLDLDGDLEILVPTEDGILNVLDHTGVSVGGGFPWNSGDGERLSSAALANLRSGFEPEIAFNTGNEQVQVLTHLGASIGGYPITTTSPLHPRHNSPAIERIHGSSSDLVAVMSHYSNAWDNFGQEIIGWPVHYTLTSYAGPAVADIDLDGRLEVVLMSGYSSLHVIDVGNPPNSPDASWPMYGHDPQRTGCSDCPEDVLTAVDPNPAGERITRVSFAAPSPNPVSGSTRFSYAVPSRAVVSLEIFDLRGARLATVQREEFGPGQRVLSWDGRDRHGAQLASGHYFARLRVRGPGVSEDLVRKLTILR